MNDSYSEDPADYYEYDYESSVSEHASHSIQMVSMVLFSIACVLGIPGNAFVIWIAGMKMKKTVNTIWYVNLAVADLFCCVAIPFIMSQRLLDDWPYGVAMCKVLPMVIMLNMLTSVFTLTLISLDRFTLVIWPVWAKNHRSISGARLLCGLAWFLSLLLNLPDLIYYEILEVNNKTYCYVNDTQLDTTAIYITTSVLGFPVPLLVITVCYLLIARRVSVGQFKSQKALRIMVGVVTAFFVCWMPYFTVGLVVEYGEKSSAEVAQAVSPLAVSLACINSCLNPVLYVFMGKDLKERVRVSLRHIFEKAFSEDATCSSVSSKRLCLKSPSLPSSKDSTGSLSHTGSNTKCPYSPTNASMAAPHPTSRNSSHHKPPHGPSALAHPTSSDPPRPCSAPWETEPSAQPLPVCGMLSLSI